MKFRCANSEALNSYMRDQEATDKVIDGFVRETEKALLELREELELIRASAKNYQGYDLTDTCEEVIKDALGV